MALGSLDIRICAARNSVRSSMFIAPQTYGARTPSGVPCARWSKLHFTPNGVSTPAAIVTINIALLTEGGAPFGGSQHRRDRRRACGR